MRSASKTRPSSARRGVALVAIAAAGVLTLGGAAAAAPGVPEIVPGSDNEAGVRCVQTAYNTVAGTSLDVDGEYGPATTQATRDFQAFFGLGVDGRVGPKTGGTIAYIYDLTVGAGAWKASGCWDVVPSDEEAEPPPAGAYTLPLPRDAVTRGEYGQAHWDGEPEIDLIVPEGTPVYALTSGHAWPHDDASCGTHVHLDGDDGGKYIFCHMSSTAVGDQRVDAGTQLGLSGDTGSSGAPHLHIQVDYPSGTKRCPQPMLLAIYDGAAVPGPADLPTSACAR